MTPPLIPLPDMVLLHADPALLLELTQIYRDFLPPPEPVHGVDTPLVASREGLCDASTEPTASRDHPLVSAGRAGCPYWMTCYIGIMTIPVSIPSLVCTTPGLLSAWVPRSRRRLLCRPPADWLQVINRRDTLHTALQLQRDASLMSSHMAVLHQYAIALHQMSTEVLHSVFGREFFPSGAVNDVAPCPACLGRRPMWQLWVCGDPGCSGWSQCGPCTPVPGVPRLCLVSPTVVRLVVEPVHSDCLPAPVYAGYYYWLNLNSVVHIIKVILYSPRNY